MSLTSFVVSRNWASSRLRTALTVLGIALGVAVVVAIHVMDHNTIRSRQIGQDPERGPVDLEVTPNDRGRSLDDVRADLRRRPGVADVAIWREGRCVLERGARNVAVAVYGLDPLPPGPFAHYRVADGRDLSAADGDGAVLLGAAAALLLGVGPGDTVTLAEAAEAQQFECRGGELVPVARPAGQRFATTVTVAGVLAEERLGRRNLRSVVVCARSLCARASAAGLDLLQVQRTWGGDLDRLREQLRPDYVVQDLRAAMIGEGADERAFRNGIKVLGCLALILGMFVVFQTLSHSLVTRVRQLGLLRSLGATQSAIARIFLVDALALGALGSGLGVLLGIGLAALLKQYNISSLGMHKAWLVFELPIAPVAWTGALGVFFTLAGAAFPLWRARSVSPLFILQAQGLSGQEQRDADLLRGVNGWLFVLLVVVLPLAYLGMTPLVSEEGLESLVVLLELVGMLALFGGLLLLAPPIVVALGRVVLWPLRQCAPLSGWFVGRVLARNARRVAAGVCGLSAVLLALLGLKSLTAALHGEVDQFAAAALNDRVFLGMKARPASEVAVLRGVPGVRAVEPLEGTVRPGFLLRGLAVEHVAGRDGALEPWQDRVRRYADTRIRTLVASHRLAAKMRWQEGGTISLRDRDGVPVAYEVLAVSDRSGYAPSDQAWAVTSPHWMKQDFCVSGPCVQEVTVHLEPGADAHAVAGRCKDLLGSTRMFHGADLRAYNRRDVDRDFFLFDLLLGLILLLACMGLLNGMAIGAIGRIRELGVLRALGVANRSLRATFLLEGVIVGVLAGGLAAGLCVPMAHVLIAGLNRVAGLAAPFALPWGWLGAVPLIAVATGLVAAIVPAARAVRASPAESVRYE